MTTPGKLPIGTAIRPSHERLRTVANGCEVADACGRVRTVADGWTTSSEHSFTPTPPVKREPSLRIREKLIHNYGPNRSVSSLFSFLFPPSLFVLILLSFLYFSSLFHFALVSFLFSLFLFLSPSSLLTFLFPLPSFFLLL